MKNIHILPTKQKSIYWINSEGKLCMGCYTYGSDRVDFYITSDEEIKKGDWCITISISTGQTFIERYKWSSYNHRSKKIILTTNQDLIKDGVQAIPNEFLLWFVKNQSCEFVEVKLEWHESKHNTNVGYTTYKIIIPKLEIPNPINNIREKVEELRKQETLEEASVKYGMDTYPSIKLEDYTPIMKLNYAQMVTAFRYGAKWQQEQSKNLYSEDVVEFVANEMVNWAIDNIGNPNPQSGKKFDEIIVKYKNK